MEVGQIPERYENTHLGHDLPPTTFEQVALRALVDALFARSDEAVFKILSKYVAQPHEEQ